MAGVCQSTKLLWNNDKVLEQFECGSSVTSICVSKAVFGSDNSVYVKTEGAIQTPYGSHRISGLGWSSHSKEGKFEDINGFLTLNYYPSPAAIIDSYAIRSKFVLDKQNKKASYLEQRKEVLSFQSWKTYVAASDLNCTKVK